jgi:hypothetical protein
MRAPVDEEIGARHIRRGVGEQKSHRGRDIGRLSNPTQRHGRFVLGPFARGIGGRVEFGP